MNVACINAVVLCQLQQQNTQKVIPVSQSTLQSSVGFHMLNQGVHQTYIASRVVFQISSLSVASICKPVHREVICLNQRKYGKIAWKYIKIIRHYFVMLQNWLPADFILSLLSKKKRGFRAYRKLVPIFFKLSFFTALFCSYSFTLPAFSISSLL